MDSPARSRPLLNRVRLKHLSPLIGLALFGLALYVLDRALGENSYGDILRHLGTIPPSRIAGALGLTAVSYSVLTLYDHLGLAYLEKPLGRLRVSLASFISYCFSRNIGFTVLTGGSIRYRFYSAWGLTAEEIARLIAFAVLSFSLGLLTMGGAIALLSPAALPDIPYLPLQVLRPAGALALAAVFVYLLLVLRRRHPLQLRGWRLPLPRPRLALTQVAVGALDWTLTSLVLFYLLADSAPVTLPEFLQIYLLAQLAATASHVPGGLGVFETVILLLIPEMAAPDLLGTLLVYRGIYYLLPFALSILLLAILEAMQHGQLFRRAGAALGRWLAGFAPPILAGSVLVSGALLLLSTVTPTVPGRLERLAAYLPAPVMEAAHLLSALAGGGMLLIARGLQMRLRGAYRLARAVLIAGIPLVLLKGLTWELAVVFALLLAALWLCGEFFYRRPALLDEPFPVSWSVLLGGVLALCGWFLALSHSAGLPGLSSWRELGRQEELARSLRGFSAVLLLLGGFALLRLLRHRPVQPSPPAPRERERAHLLLGRETRGWAQLALYGENRFLFGPSGAGLLAFREARECWVGLGDPVGTTAERQEVAWRFRERAEMNHRWPVLLFVGEQNRELCLELGLALQPVATEMRIVLDALPEGWETVSTDRPEVLKAGAAVDEVGRISPALALGEGEWDFRRAHPLILIRREGEVQALATLLAGADRREVAMALVRGRSDLSEETLSSFLRGALSWAREEGFQCLTLGPLPLPEEFSPSVFKTGGETPIGGMDSPWSGLDFGRLLPPRSTHRSMRYLALPGEAPLRRVLADAEAAVREFRL